MSDIRVRRQALSARAAESLLERHHVGSMAMTFHDRVTIMLVSYVYHDRWIYGRIEDGPNLANLRHHHWVAFQVSEIDGIYDWRAVTIAGAVEFLTDGGNVRESDEYRRALELLRSTVPDILTARDPMPERVQLLRIYADEIVGNEVRSNSALELPSA